MKAKLALLIVPTLFLLGCQTSTTTTTAAASTYICADGRTVEASYPDHENAVLTIGNETFHLHTERSASGARYVGDNWQWWTKGMQDAQLAPLKPGETIASDQSVACKVP